MKKSSEQNTKSAMNTKAAEATDSFEVSDEAKKAQDMESKTKAAHTADQQIPSMDSEMGAEQQEVQEATASEADDNSSSNEGNSNTSNTSTDAELQQLKDQLIRVMADNQNIKRRAESDRLRFFEEAKSRYIGLFLPIFDDLTRSIAMSETVEIPEAFLNGLKLVNQKFEEVFEREKVERIDQTMVPFNVDVHEALMKQPAPDSSVESDTVLQVFEPGYKIGGKVIKHAKVIVSE